MKFELNEKTIAVLIVVVFGLLLTPAVLTKNTYSVRVEQPFAQIGQQPQQPSGPLPSSFDTKIPYSEAVKAGKPIAVEFYADWCPYSRAFAPVFDNVRKQYESKVTFVTINSDVPENKKIMQEFGVQGFPSVYLVNPKTNTKQPVQNRFELKTELDKFLKENQ